MRNFKLKENKIKREVSTLKLKLSLKIFDWKTDRLIKKYAKTIGKLPPL